MLIGVQLPEIEYEATWPQIREMATIAEASGLDSLWVGDHLLYDLPEGRRGPWEAWSMLAALAAVTERVQIGPLVAALPFHNPAVLAKKAVTIDEISGGRLILGVGAGWNRFEFDAYGLPFARRVDRFAEAFTIVRTLVTDGRIDFAGEFYTLADCELRPPPPRQDLPIWVGSNRPRMLGLTLPYVAGWNSWFSGFGNDPLRIAGLNSEVDAACERAGRNPKDVIRSVALYIGWGPPERPRTADQPLTGSSEQLVEHLRVVEAAGIDHIQCVLDPITAGSVEKLADLAAAYRAAR
ncbi:MAG TPA: LLM class flavin-dependent oxidoreductase [Acidimicrobiia bacterium]|jgi:probable F420-dependent oxidoreductase